MSTPTNLDQLSERFLVILGLSSESAKIVMERIAELESKLSESIAKHYETHKKLQAASTERDTLAQWQKEQLQVKAWWDEVDAFVRKHPDSGAVLGYNVSHIALHWLKERDALKLALALSNEVLKATMYHTGNDPCGSIERIQRNRDLLNLTAPKKPWE